MLCKQCHFCWNGMQQNLSFLTVTVWTTFIVYYSCMFSHVFLIFPTSIHFLLFTLYHGSNDNPSLCTKSVWLNPFPPVVQIPTQNVLAIVDIPSHIACNSAEENRLDQSWISVQNFVRLFGRISESWVSPDYNLLVMFVRLTIILGSLFKVGLVVFRFIFHKMLFAFLRSGSLHFACLFTHFLLSRYIVHVMDSFAVTRTTWY